MWKPAVRVGALALLVGFAVFPIYWMVLTSLLPENQLFVSVPRFVPDPASVDAFVSLFTQSEMASWLRNSVIIAGGTTLLSLIMAVLAAYALSRFRFPGRGVIGIVFFGTQMLPASLLVAPIFTIFVSWNLINQLYGLILVDTAFVMPILTWILKGAIDSVPHEIEEAALIDGCNRLEVLIRVVFPVIWPAVAAAGTIAFFSGWDEYLFARTFLNDSSMWPATVGLVTFIGLYTIPFDRITAGALVFTLPAVVFFLFAQRYLVSGITGAVKG